MELGWLPTKSFEHGLRITVIGAIPSEFRLSTRPPTAIGSRKTRPISERSL